MKFESGLRKAPFLSGVFLVTFSSLLFQILQTRIMSVIAWYYLAFFAISVAMLGMTIGAVLVYLWRDRFQPAELPVTLSNFALLTAVAMPGDRERCLAAGANDYLSKPMRLDELAEAVARQIERRG